MTRADVLPGVLPPQRGGSGLKLALLGVQLSASGVLPPQRGGSGLKLALLGVQLSASGVLPPQRGGSGLKLLLLPVVRLMGGSPASKRRERIETAPYAYIESESKVFSRLKEAGAD